MSDYDSQFDKGVRRKASKDREADRVAEARRLDNERRATEMRTLCEIVARRCDPNKIKIDRQNGEAIVVARVCAGKMARCVSIRQGSSYEIVWFDNPEFGVREVWHYISEAKFQNFDDAVQALGELSAVTDSEMRDLPRKAKAPETVAEPPRPNTLESKAIPAVLLLIFVLFAVLAFG